MYQIVSVFSHIFLPYLKIIQALIESTQPSLNLELIKEIREEKRSLCLYKQRNVKVTRKQILPIVQKTALLHGNEKI